MRKIVEATAGTPRELEDRGVLARILTQAGKLDEAEEQLRKIYSEAVKQNDFAIASLSAGDLASLMIRTNQAEEALPILKDKARHTKAAKLGPWSQLGDQILNLQVMQAMGRNRAVLNQVKKLQLKAAALGPSDPAKDRISDWNVRETLLDVGRIAASALNRWKEAWSFYEMIAQIERDRNASAFERANSAFLAHPALVELGRFGEAQRLLAGCRHIFELEGQIGMIWQVLVAQAKLERRLGHTPEATNLAKAALRLSYAGRAIPSIGENHTLLADCFQDAGGVHREALCHRIAGAMIEKIVTGKTDVTMRALAQDVLTCKQNLGAEIPQSLPELVSGLERIDGTRFRDLLLAVNDEMEDAELLFADIIAEAYCPSGGAPS
jgi:tetratricopeptide (TPR) repeat protein